MAKKKKSSASTSDLRGVADAAAAADWLEDRGLEDIECIVPDMSGVARGKMMPVSKFIDAPTMSIPGSIFTQTITGDYPDDDDAFQIDAADSDIKLVPDYSTLAVVPWASDPTGQIIHDAYHQDGRPVEIAPRQLLRRIIGLYEHKGWKPVVAPELEFYLVERNQDPDYPLKPPVGRSGRPESGRQSYSIAAVNEFDDLFDDIYDFSEAQGLEIDTLIHEEGVAQMEINLRHGDPLALADQVFLFKRTIREAALKHETYATFMAKPIQGQPGSAMHIHQSVIDRKTGRNVFANEDGSESDAFRHFIGGMQKHVPSALVMFAPYVNSYRRLTQAASAPVNTKWGYDNRTTAFRIPRSDPSSRRVENRIPSSDANPYLALAASLACGLIGMTERTEPEPPVSGTVNEDEIELPRGLIEAVGLFEEDEALRTLLGEPFVTTYAAIKKAEFETFMEVISPWEREYLLLNV